MKTKQIFKAMNVISWIVFIGYCIKTGAIALVSITSFFGNEKVTENLYMGIDLSGLYSFNFYHYTAVVLLLIVIASLKAYIFYVLITIFKIIDFNKPFKTLVVNKIFKISKAALVVGIIGVFCNSYLTWLRHKVFLSQIETNTSAFIFMAGVVFIVATLFKRAIEIQSENELTI